MPVSIALAIMFLSYAIAAAITYMALSIGKRSDDDVMPLMACSLGLGPMGLSFFQELALFSGVYRDPETVLYGTYSVLILVGGVLALFRHRRRCLLDGIRYLVNLLGAARFELVSWVCLAAILVICALLLVEGYLFPLTANDPLEYAVSARLLFQDLSLDAYPYVEPTNHAGYYGPWTHPLGYVLLMFWGYAIQGTAAVAGAIKFITPYYAICAGALVFAIVYRETKAFAASFVGALALLLTPIFMLLALDSHIEPVRLFTMLGAIYGVSELYKRADTANTVLAGLTLGSALYSHSINIILLPLFFVMTSIFLIRCEDRRRLAKGFLLALAIGCLFVLPRFVSNVAVFGSVIADAGAVPLWALPALEYEHYFRVARGIEHMGDRIMFGALKPLLDIRYFGIWYALLVVMIIIRFVVERPMLDRFNRWLIEPSLSSVLVWSFLGLTGMVWLSVLLGLDVFIKNERYMLTAQPIAACLLGLLLARWVPPGLGSWRSAPIYHLLSWLRLDR